MRSSTRTLLVLGVMTLGGLGALSWIGRQYSRALRDATSGRAGAPRPGPQEADRRTRAFVQVRRAMKAAFESDRDLDGVRTARAQALERTGLAPGDYAALLLAYREWKERATTGDRALDAAFDGFRAEIAAVELGRYDRLVD